jgi:hypothetical protein
LGELERKRASGRQRANAKVNVKGDEIGKREGARGRKEEGEQTRESHTTTLDKQTDK